MKKLRHLVLEICYAVILAHKWHSRFSKVLQFVRADALIQQQILGVKEKTPPVERPTGEENGIDQF